jgi:predicted transcriptional regulator
MRTLEELTMAANPQSFKRRAHELIDALPDDADWKDLVYEASVIQDIEEGLRDSEAGRVVSNAEVRKQFGLPE